MMARQARKPNATHRPPRGRQPIRAKPASAPISHKLTGAPISHKAFEAKKNIRRSLRGGIPLPTMIVKPNC